MQRLQTLIVDRGQLLHVVDVDEHFKGSAFALTFETGTTLLIANSKDDSVVIIDLADVQMLDGVLDHRQFEELRTILAEGLVFDSARRDRHSLGAVWSSVVGSSPVWAWFLTNNLGFNDGIQVEFTDAERTRTTIQLLVSASKMTVRRVED